MKIANSRAMDIARNRAMGIAKNRAMGIARAMEIAENGSVFKRRMPSEIIPAISRTAVSRVGELRQLIDGALELLREAVEAHAGSRGHLGCAAGGLMHQEQFAGGRGGRGGFGSAKVWS